MNIYHIISTKKWDFSHQYIYDLAKAQKLDGHYVEIICRPVDEIISHYRKLEIPISTLSLNGVTDLESAKKLKKIIRNHGDVIINAHNFKSAITAALARNISDNENIKIVVTRHIAKKGKSGFIYNTLYSSIDKVIFVSQHAKDIFLNGNPKIDDKKLEVLNESISLDAPAIANLRESFKIAPEKRIIVSHGNLCAENGTDILIKALSQIDKEKYYLFLIGKGSNLFISNINNIIVANQLQDNIAIVSEDVHPQSYIAQCDFGVFPSIDESASLIPCLDFMIMSKPFICSSNGAQTEYFEHRKDSYIVYSNDPYSLAAAISDFLDNPHATLHLGERGKETFEKKFAYHDFYSNILNIYQKL